MLATFCFSCIGNEGIDGVKGVDGVDGQDGTDGVDGADGNANAKTYIYNNPAWPTAGSGLFLDTSSFLTQDNITNDLILTYVTPASGNSSPVPGFVFDPIATFYREFNVIIQTPSTIAIVSREANGDFTPNANLTALETVKIIIVEATSVTVVSKGTKRMTVLDTLSKAGVDVNDYDAVCDYYDIRH